MKTNSIVTIIDLKQIAKELANQFNPDDDFRYPCECGEMIYQTMNKCPSCDKPVIWLNSSVWEDNFGSAKLALSKYKAIHPTTETGKLLCELAGAQFVSKAEEQAWANLERRLGTVECTKIITWVMQRSMGRSAISFAINVGKKKSPRPIKKDGPETMGGEIW